jgi:hypothetical protein
MELLHFRIAQLEATVDKMRWTIAGLLALTGGEILVALLQHQ